MPCERSDAIIRRARRRFAHDGYTLIKYRKGSTLYAVAGPFALADPDTGQIIMSRLTLDEIDGSLVDQPLYRAG